MSEGSGFGGAPGNQQPAGVVYESGRRGPDSGQEDGQAVGAADVEADRATSGAGTDDGGMDNAVVGDAAERNTYDPLEDDVPASEDGQGLGVGEGDAGVDELSGPADRNS